MILDLVLQKSQALAVSSSMLIDSNTECKNFIIFIPFANNFSYFISEMLLLHAANITGKCYLGYSLSTRYSLTGFSLDITDHKGDNVSQTWHPQK